MTDYQHLVDNIRAFLASANQVRSDELADWALDYARACTEANDRLRRCTEYLQKGLRTEAIHAAEEQPNLLDLVATLDLQELEAWRGICFQYDLTDPPALAIESAAALNEAYAGEDTVAALLTRHRLLALACAPVKDRIATMRRLAESDPTSPFWDEDLRTFERARLEEIRTTVPQLAKAGNAAAAQHIYEELESQAWRTPVSSDLRHRAYDVVIRLRHAEAEASLQKLLPALNDAYSAMSFAECRSLLDQWDTVVADNQMTVPPELQEKIEPIVSWVAERQAAQDKQAAFDEACNQLQQALDVDAPEAKLERSYLAVSRMPLQMPEELEQRYQTRLVTHASARRNKRLLILTGIVAAFLLMAGAAIAVTFQIMRNREIADAQMALHNGLQDVDSGNTGRPDAMMKALLVEHPSIAQNPGVVKAASDLRSAIDGERQRAAQFQQHMNAVLANGADHPDLNELQLAEPLAKLDGEKTQLAAEKQQIADLKSAEQHDRDKKFMDDAKALADAIDSGLPDQLLQSDASIYQTRLSDFEKQVTLLGTRTGITSQLMDSQVHTALALLKHKRDALEATENEQSMLDQLGRASSSDGQVSILKQYLDKFPNSLRAADFRRAVDQAPEAQAIEAWGPIRQSWPQLIPLDAEDAAARVQRAGDYLKVYPSSPFASSLGAYVTYLRLAQQMTAADGPWKKGYRDLLNNPLVHDLQMVETQDGKTRYYTLGNINYKHPTANGQIISEEFDAVTSSDVSKRTHISLRLGGEKGFLKYTTPVPSPQAVFAEDATRRIDAMTLSNWEQLGPQIVGQLASREDMNLVLRSILLQNALQTCQPVLDWAGDSACKTVMDGLAKQGLDNVEWLDPDNPPAPSLTDSLKDLLGAISSTERMVTIVARQRELALQGVPASLKVQGVVIRNPSGLRLSIPPEGPGMAYAIGEAGTLVQIGHADAQTWSVDNTKASEVTDGGLVFVTAAAK
jgi:hypothetical protein